jgi:hypothetical protein
MRWFLFLVRRGQEVVMVFWICQAKLNALEERI